MYLDFYHILVAFISILSLFYMFIQIKT